MVKKLKDGEASAGQPLKKAKNFFWKILTVIFGFLFVASIVICVLFATGIIAIVEDEDSGVVRLRYVSPLVPKEETKTTDNPSSPSASNTESEPEFTGDNVGWAPAVQKQCEEGNSTCEKNLAKLPSIASFDLDMAGLTYNAGLSHSGETLSVADIRFTSNGRYIVARLVSNQTQGSTIIVNDIYFYRSTYNSQGWAELKGLGNNQSLDCTQLNDTQKLIVEDVYSERGCANNDNY